MRPFTRTGNAWVFACGFLALFLAVDWVTFIYDTPAINVTSWNPPAGIYLALLLLAPPYASALVFLALMLGDVLVRGMPAPPGLLAASNLLILAGYWSAVRVLRDGFGVQPTLDRLSDLVRLVVAVPLAAIPVAFGFVIPYMVGGLLPWSALLPTTLQYWVGDVIGILAVTPFLLVHRPWSGWRWLRMPSAETVLQALAVAVGLLVTFNKWVPDPAKLFYVLFLPIIWIAMRRGLPGATVAILATQIGLVVGLQAVPGHWEDVTYYQTLMLALAATGLLVGAVVSERWRLEQSLRDRQAELARVSRLSLLGEMASSLAHELNQPLFTTVGYTRASRQLLMRDAPRNEVVDLMDRAVTEAERAAGVLKGIRGFLRPGGSPAAISLRAVVDEMMVLAGPEARRNGIAVHFSLPADLPKLWADQVQVHQVLLNLVRNSIDALSDISGRDKQITVAARAAAGMVEVSVSDNGPGVPEEEIGPLFDLFFTTKPSGMGLGLPISRSIIETHGGRLWLAANGSDGSRFSFTLPAAV